MNELDHTLERYLLDQLEGDELETIEAQLLVEDDTFEALGIVEAELADRFERGELAANDRAALLRRASFTPRLQERLQFARVMHRLVDAPADNVRPFRPPAPPETASRPIWRALPWAAALIAAVGAGVFGVQSLKLQAERAEVYAQLQQQAVAYEGRVAELSAREATQATAAEQLRQEAATRETRLVELERQLAHPGGLIGRTARAAVASLAMITRGSEAETVLRFAPRDDRATIEIELPPAAGTRVRVLVLRDEVVVWNEPDLRVESSVAGTLARLSLPRQALTAGRYRVQAFATSSSSQEPVASYTLLVQRPNQTP